MMSYSDSQVRLYRDSLSTPWGFRLQGGADFKAPLTVQRVFVGSPADGTLSRGDVITSIENYDASRMIHKQAMDIVKVAGGSLTLSIYRSASQPRTPTSAAPQFQPQQPQPYRSRPPDTAALKTPVSPGAAPEFGMDYSKHAQPKFVPQQNQVASHHGLGYTHKGPPPTMLDRIQNTLSGSLWSPDEGDVDYEYRGVGDLKKQFGYMQTRDSPERDRLNVKQLKTQYNALDRKAQTLPRARQRASSHQSRKPVSVGAGPVWRKPEANSVLSRPPPGLIEPGWTPKSSKPGTDGWKPVPTPGTQHQAPRPTQHVQAPQTVYRPPPQPVAAQAPVPVNRQRQSAASRPTPGIYYIKPESPAWVGSLKSSGGPKPWEMREAEAISGGGGSGIPPAAQAPASVHQPRVQTLAYGQVRPSSYGQSDTAQVKHLQYNSPIGLYSKDNAIEALSGQTHGKPGEGTLHVSGGGPGRSFDPDRSDVLRLLQEEETIKKRGYGLRPQGSPATQGARFGGDEMHHQGFMNHSKKSPAMARLEYNLESGNVGIAVPASGEGTSDF